MGADLVALTEFCLCSEMPTGVKCPPCRAIEVIDALSLVAIKAGDLITYADVDPPDFAQHLKLALDNFNRVYDSDGKAA